MPLLDLVSTLTRCIADWARGRGGPGLVVGVSGPQGSGKSTLAAGLERALGREGLQAVVLSLDDLYLTRPERLALAASVHPLFATRGPPGTHDVALGLSLLERLGRPGAVTPPRFDKATDTRAPAGEIVTGPFDVILFEGWCLGAEPASAAELRVPINALEREHDADGVWRGQVNAALAGRYQALWRGCERLILLRPTTFDVVLGWRLQQERDLRARMRDEGREVAGTMSNAEVARFVEHFERITRRMLAHPPDADIVVELDPERRPTAKKLPLKG